MELKEDKEEKTADYHMEENIEKDCEIGKKDRMITRKK